SATAWSCQPLPPHERGDWPNPRAPHRAAHVRPRVPRRGRPAPCSPRSRKAAPQRRPSKGQHVIDPPCVPNRDTSIPIAPVKNPGPAPSLEPAKAREGPRRPKPQSTVQNADGGREEPSQVVRSYPP